MALNNIAWINVTKLIIHISDAPAQGSDWCEKNNHNDENPKLYPLIKNVLIEKLKSLVFKYVHPRSLHLKNLKNYMKKMGIII